MRHAVLFAALCLPVPVQACPGDLILSCTAKGGTRALEVCLEGDAFTYAYGPVGRAPELTLREPLANGTLYPWQGFGRAIAESIGFANGPFRYEVFYSVDRLDENHPSEGSVSVTRDGAEIAYIACDPGSAELGLFAAQDGMQALGLCWSQDAEGWTTTCP